MFKFVSTLFHRPLLRNWLPLCHEARMFLAYAPIPPSRKPPRAVSPPSARLPIRRPLSNSNSRSALMVTLNARLFFTRPWGWYLFFFQLPAVAKVLALPVPPLPLPLPLRLPLVVPLQRALLVPRSTLNREDSWPVYSLSLVRLLARGLYSNMVRLFEPLKIPIPITISWLDYR